jgi:hypothetical protein
MIRRWTFVSVISLFVFAALGTRASAQCFNGPDGLTGPCWEPTQAILPSFPDISLPATNICWTNCAPNQLCSRVTLPAPAFVSCGVYTSDLVVSDCAATPNDLLKGRLRMDYTRTWDESDPGPPARRVQVYRFVVKIDMDLVNASTCYTPSCLPAVTAFYYGYVDYAFDCGTGAVEASMVLFHNCDLFIHGPQSATPGAFHPNTTYAIVAPHTALNPFTPAIPAPPAGNIVAEAVRNVSVPGATCTYEDPIASGAIGYLGSVCGCSFNFTPPQLSARTFRGMGSCLDPTGAATTFTTVNATPAFPWFHMMTTAIGVWTTPLTYPGEEAAWVDEAAIYYKDSCTATAGLATAWGEVYYGASTSQGYAVVPGPLAPPLTPHFTDLASNTWWALPGAPPSTFMGKVLPSRNLIYVNVP